MSDLTRLLCAVPAFAYGPLVWVMTRAIARNDFRQTPPGTLYNFAFWLWMIYPGIVGGFLVGEMFPRQFEVLYRSWPAFFAAIVMAITMYAHWIMTSEISKWAVAAIRRDIDAEAEKRIGSGRATKGPVSVEAQQTSKMTPPPNGEPRVHTWEEIVEQEVVKRVSILAGGVV